MWGGVMLRAMNVRKSNARAVQIKPNPTQPIAEYREMFFHANFPFQFTCGSARVRLYATLGPSQSQTPVSSICPRLSRGCKCAITLFDMTVETRDYIFENFLERLQLFQICQHMLKISLGWRRGFYEQQLIRHGNKIRKMIETWPASP
jgi:hypothetical protein